MQCRKVWVNCWLDKLYLLNKYNLKNALSTYLGFLNKNRLDN